MIEIGSPTAPQRRSFAPLTIGLRGRALFDSAMQSPIPAPKAPETDPSGRAKRATRRPNAAHPGSIFASSVRSRQLAVLKSP